MHPPYHSEPADYHTLVAKVVDPGEQMPDPGTLDWSDLSFLHQYSLNGR
jgi:hypothetical protein